MIAIALSALVLLAPLRSYSVLGGFGVTISPYRVALAALVWVFTVAAFSRRENLRVARRSHTFFFFVLIFEASLLISAARGSPEFGDSWTRFFVRALGFLVAAFLVLLLNSRRRFLVAAKSYVWSAVLPIAGAVFQEAAFIATRRIPPLPGAVALDEDSTGIGTIFRGLPRVSSTLLEPNYLGMFCSAVILLGVARVYASLAARRRPPLGVVAVAFGAALALVFTLSLSAIAGLALGLMAFSVVMRVRWSVAGVVAGLGAGAVIAADFALAAMGSSLGLLEMVSARVGGRMESADLFDRGEFFSVGMDAFLSNPLLGAGLGRIQSAAGISTAHNSFLTVLGEQGLLGFSGAFGAYLVVVWYSVQNVRRLIREGDYELACLGAGLISALIALMTSSVMYDALFSFDSSWVILGMAAAYSVNAKSCSSISAQRGASAEGRGDAIGVGPASRTVSLSLSRSR